jgi:hypothetical protein
MTDPHLTSRGKASRVWGKGFWAARIRVLGCRCALRYLTVKPVAIKASALLLWTPPSPPHRPQPTDLVSEVVPGGMFSRIFLTKFSFSGSALPGHPGPTLVLARKPGAGHL